MAQQSRQRRLLLTFSGMSLLGWLSALTGCSTPAPPAAVQVDRPRPLPSLAQSPKAYRVDAAKHLYSHHGHQIFKGKLPPLLHAVSVVRVNIAANGDLIEIDWMRKPTHAPEVVAEIERKILAAEPFPAPVHLGPQTYTETWLWHKSWLFQLDTLTEGQV